MIRLPRWLRPRTKPTAGSQPLPTMRPHPDRPVPVNPPWRKDYATEENWLAAIYDHQSRLAEFNRQQRLKLGITHFTWLWVKAGNPPCHIGQRNNGKVFSYSEPPPGAFQGPACAITTIAGIASLRRLSRGSASSAAVSRKVNICQPSMGFRSRAHRKARFARDRALPALLFGPVLSPP